MLALRSSNFAAENQYHGCLTKKNRSQRNA